MRHVTGLREHFAGKLNIPDFSQNPTAAHLNHQSSYHESFEKGPFPILFHKIQSCFREVIPAGADGNPHICTLLHGETKVWSPGLGSLLSVCTLTN